MALFDKFKKKDKDPMENYPTLTPGLDDAGLGPAGVPKTPPSGAGLPPLPTATTPAPTVSPHTEVLQNKIDMLISKIDALKSALDMLNQKIAQLETQHQHQQQNPADQRFDIYGGEQQQSSGEQKQGSDYSSGGWQF